MTSISLFHADKKRGHSHSRITANMLALASPFCHLVRTREPTSLQIYNFFYKQHILTAF